MKILFVGSVYLSEKILEKLILINEEIVGVVSKNESDFNSDFCDISQLAQKNNIPFYKTEDINGKTSINWIKSKIPDIIFCFGWSKLLKSEVLKIPRLGVLGYHPSLLPYNRGRHPLIWAKILGLKKTGSTFFFMDEGADTGDIISQKEFEITFEDNASTLYNKMVKLAITQVLNFLPALKNNSFKRIKQLEKKNYWRKRTNSDGLIDFRMDSISICNLVRALTKPYVGSHCNYTGDEIKIWEIEKGKNNSKNIEPGKVIKVYNNQIEVKTGSTSVILTKHEFYTLPKINEYLL